MQEEAPRLRVRVLRHGLVVHEEICENADEAAELEATWGDVQDAIVEIDDLAGHPTEEDEFLITAEDDYTRG